MTPQLATSMLEGVPRVGDVWAAGYPLADELDAVRAWLQGSAPLEVGSPFGLYVIRTRAQGAACGGIGFFGAPGEDGAVEIGYGLVPAVRGRGLATEALRALLVVAAGHGARSARADTAVDNTASQRVLQRAGMRQVRRDQALAYYEVNLPHDPDQRSSAGGLGQAVRTCS